MSKQTDSWMPLYVSEWERDTGHLTNEEDGAYGRLIRWYWANGPLPDDDKKLGSIIRDHRAWKRLRPSLIGFFSRRDGFWYHKRVEAELARARGIIAKRTIAGEIGANKRWGKTTAQVVPIRREEE